MTGTNYKNTQQTGAAVGSDAYNAAHPTVTLMQPLINSIRGSGDIDTLATTAGSLSDNIQGKVHYNIGLTYTKTGTNLKGQVQMWYFRSGSAAEGGGQYYIKSNSLSSLSVDALTTSGTLYSKASVYKIVNGATVSIDGNVTLRVDMLDGKSTTDASFDKIAFTVISSKSELYYSNNWQYDTAIKSWRSMLEDVMSGPNDHDLGILIN